MGRPPGSKKPPGLATLAPRTTRSNARFGGDEAPVSRFQRLATKEFEDQWPIHMTNSKHGLQNRPRQTAEEFFGPDGYGSSGPDPFRPYWTDADEVDMMANYPTSLMKHCIDMISSGDHELHSLWKACIRLFGMDPLTLMNDLEVDAQGNGTLLFKERVRTNPIWSKGFCKKLTRIICHPFWRGPWRDEILNFTLRYAAMCRQDDRRPFEFPNPVSCRVLDGLFEAQNVPDMSLHERHLMLREDAFRRRILPSIESDLLAQLGNLVYVSRVGLEEPTSTITVLDLTRVMQALDSLQNDGLHSHVSTEIAYQMFLAARGTQDVPVGIDQLRVAYENCRLNRHRGRVYGRKEREKNGSVGRGSNSEDDDTHLPADHIRSPSPEETGNVIPETQPRGSRPSSIASIDDEVVRDSQDDGLELPHAQVGEEKLLSSLPMRPSAELSPEHEEANSPKSPLSSEALRKPPRTQSVSRRDDAVEPTQVDKSPELGTNEVSGTGRLPRLSMLAPNPFGLPPVESGSMADRGTEGFDSRGRHFPSILNAIGPTPAKSGGMADQAAEGESPRSQGQFLPRLSHVFSPTPAKSGDMVDHESPGSQEQPLPEEPTTESEDHTSLGGTQPLPSKSPGPIRKRRPFTHARDAKRRRLAMETKTRKGVAPLDGSLLDGEGCSAIGSRGQPDV